MRLPRPIIFAGIACLGMISSAHAQAPAPGQPYQIPEGYTGYGPGTLISYGGFNYVIQGDGTMLLAAETTDNTTTTADQPVAGQPYQVPGEFTGSEAGNVVSYGGSDYVIQGNGTMILQQPMDTGGGSIATQPGTIISDSQPGFAYGSYYAGPGPTGYVGDTGAGSYSASSFNLGIGIYGKPGWGPNSGGKGSKPGYPSGGKGSGPWVKNKPAWPSHPSTNHPGGQMYHPGGQMRHPGGQMYHPGGQMYHPGGQIHRPGGQMYHPGGQMHHSGGQATYARGNSVRPSGGGFSGGRAMRRR